MVRQVFDALVLFTLVGTAACLAVMLLREPVRRLAGSGLAYWLWLIVPVALIVLALPALPQAPATETSIPGAFVGFGEPGAPAAIAQSPGATAPSTWPGAASWIIAIWAIGLSASVARILWIQHRFVSGMGRLAPDPDLPRVCYSAQAGVSPSVIGLVRARIVLPADFHRLYSLEEQRLILAHEATHLRHRHLPVSALALVLLAIQWFNPLAYLALVLFRLDQELACDAAVVRANPEARALYARAMLKAGVNRRNPPLACCWSRALPLTMKTRIRLLMLAPPPRHLRLGAGMAISGLILATGWGVYASTPHTALRLDFARPAASAPLLPSSGSLVTAQGSSGRISDALPPPKPASGQRSTPRPQNPNEAEAAALSEAPIFDMNTPEGAYSQAMYDLLTQDEKERGPFTSPKTALVRTNDGPRRVVIIAPDRLAGEGGYQLSQKLTALADDLTERLGAAPSQVPPRVEPRTSSLSVSPDSAGGA